MTQPKPPRRSTADKLRDAATSEGPPAATASTAASSAIEASSSAPQQFTKYTVHLDHNRNRALKMLALDAGTTASKVVRAFIDLAAADERFRDQAMARARQLSADPD